MTTARAKRRGVTTVPLYSNVTPEAKQVVDTIASATGSRKNVVLERIMAHVESETDERGIPTWWSDSVEELPLTG